MVDPLNKYPDCLSDDQTELHPYNNSVGYFQFVLMNNPRYDDDEMNDNNDHHDYRRERKQVKCREIFIPTDKFFFENVRYVFYSNMYDIHCVNVLFQPAYLPLSRVINGAMNVCMYIQEEYLEQMWKEKLPEINYPLFAFHHLIKQNERKKTREYILYVC